MRRRQPATRVKLNALAVWEHLSRLNMMQSELARAAGITSGYLSLLMNGKRCPSPRVRRRLQEALGVTDFDELFILEVVS